MRAQKALTIDVFVELHSLYFSGGVIAKLTGFSASHVTGSPRRE